jgi:hypothetical protein
MACGCKNNQNKAQSDKPVQKESLQKVIKTTIEKYYNKNKK